VRRLCP